MAVSEATNLARWIEENRDVLKPPVGNKLLFGDGEFQVMIVAGPNSRRDFHCEPGEELFYQLKGDITLKVIEDDAIRDIAIREGEEILRVRIGNARWNTWINPDWEHVPAAGYESAVNLSEGHEAGR